MSFTGIDIGSRSIKLVEIDENKKILRTETAYTTFDPRDQCRKLLNINGARKIITTGYGRNLLADEYGYETVSEIIAHAKGVHELIPDARLILDIGGQDTKVILLDPKGKVVKFEMNDRCAAGTGKFIEIMALAFGMTVEKFAEYAQAAKEATMITNMCTVFAESEATSLMAKGKAPESIALGLHLSITKRSVSMLRRINNEFPPVFTGGVALNKCIKMLLSKELNKNVSIPVIPQHTGAYGAALILLKAAQ